MNISSETKKSNLVLIMGIIALVCLISNVLVYAFFWESVAINGESNLFFATWGSGMSVVWGLITTVSFFLLFKNYGLKSTPGKGWFVVFVGFLLWLTADLIFMYLTVGEGQEDPFPTIADGFWAFAYPFLIIGVIMHVRAANVKIPTSEKILIAVIGGFLLMTSIYFIFYPVATADFIALGAVAETAGFEQALLLYYPILDHVLLTAALVLVFKYRGGEFSKSWVILSVGFLVTAIYDLAYSYFQFASYTYPIFENAYFFMEQIYIVYYMILTLGALYMYKTLRSLK